MTSLAGQTPAVIPFSKREETVARVCDGHINLRDTYKVILIEGKEISRSLYKLMVVVYLCELDTIHSLNFVKIYDFTYLCCTD